MKQEPSHRLQLIQTLFKLSIIVSITRCCKKPSLAQKRECGKNLTLTSSSYKIAVEEKENERIVKEEKIKIKITSKIQQKKTSKAKASKPKETLGKKGKLKV